MNSGDLVGVAILLVGATALILLKEKIDKERKERNAEKYAND
jgi:hypothetical protein